MTISALADVLLWITIRMPGVECATEASNKAEWMAFLAGLVGIPAHHIPHK